MTKKLICCFILAIIVISGAAQAAPEDGAFRLHVIGRTDLKDDQAFKLSVRDRVLEYIGALNTEDIYSGICSAADDMEAVLNDFAEAHGQERNITVETGTFPYPASYADDEYYPAGDYRAVRIRIGGGEGRNWWGMIDAGVRGEDRSGIIYYSSIVNWLMALLGWE